MYLSFLHIDPMLLSATIIKIEKRWMESQTHLLHSVIDLQGLPHNKKLLQESGELCSLYNRNLAKPAKV